MVNILILDDEEHVTKLKELYLKTLGYSTHALNSVERALELEDTSIAPISNADIIISDFDMGNNTALDLLEYLKQENLKKKVIIHSGNQNCKSIIKKASYDSLVDKYLDKTSSLFDLKQIIKEIL